MGGEMDALTSDRPLWADVDAYRLDWLMRVWETMKREVEA